MLQGSWMRLSAVISLLCSLVKAAGFLKKTKGQITLSTNHLEKIHPVISTDLCFLLQKAIA